MTFQTYKRILESQGFFVSIDFQYTPEIVIVKDKREAECLRFHLTSYAVDGFPEPYLTTQYFHKIPSDKKELLLDATVEFTSTPIKERDDLTGYYILRKTYSGENLYLVLNRGQDTKEPTIIPQFLLNDFIYQKTFSKEELDNITELKKEVSSGAWQLLPSEQVYEY